MSLDILENIASSRGLDLRVSNVQLLSSTQIREAHQAAPFGGGLLPVTPRWPVIVDALADPLDPKALSSVLGRSYPPQHRLLVLTTGDDPLEGGTDATVGDVGKPGADVLIAVIPPLPDLDAHRDPRTLQHIVARLRAPEGCPWDREQTNQSLRDALIDEVYEAVDAIDTADMENLAEELGDVFLLIAMHAQIAEESGHFTLEDVYAGIAAKITRRHPHVFGGIEAKSATDVTTVWHAVKAQEKANAGGSSGAKARDGQPHSMPALERTRRVLRKHPLPDALPHDASRGDQLLAVIAGIIDAGDDPETELRAALERHALDSTTSMS